MSTPPLSPSLQQLLWFVRIVEAGSFSEAARRAGTSTSAMSKAVSRFEQTHGIRLLHRTTHSFSLTDEGDRLFGRGRCLLDELESVEATLTELGSRSATGRVRLSAPSAFVRSVIMPELPQFLNNHPDIDIEIQSGDEIVDLAARSIDIAVRTGNLDGLPGHVFRQMYTFPWIVCATPDYLRRYGVPDKPGDLVAHRQVGFRNKSTGQIDSWRFNSPMDGTAIRHSPRPKFVFDDGAAAWSMVRAGLGIGWVPSWLGLDDLRSGDVVEVLTEWRSAEAPLFAVRLDRRLTPVRTQIVMDFLGSLSSTWQV
ncbi:LysR family transcriptional regulator [Paracoccus wurundjeri]|uniref:LysR family transcriptional regulator n=1 Tax=Paracoccus onubensis TaxID=1675788 RepID=UPI00351D91B8